MVFSPNPIKFGTDGWRGRIAADFTFERVAHVAPIAAQVLADNYGQVANNRLVVVGYDRRFMAEQFAQTVAEAVQAAGFDVLLADSYAPTPALSWAAKDQDALGALVLTASHNPAEYLGLKVKGFFGGSVTQVITQQIEARLGETLKINRTTGTITPFDPWQSYCDALRQKVDIAKIRQAIEQGQLQVFADVMHGAAATGLERLLGIAIQEINGERDPLFGGGAPEPLPKYLAEIFRTIRQAAQDQPDALRVGLVFDGDSDRIAAVDGEGNFRSSQVLIPILIEHLHQRKGFTGEIVKTVSGSDLIPRLAAAYNLKLYETPIGYKYIADRMLNAPVLVGGEESGGVGYGSHIPERDALLGALYTLEAVVESGEDVGQLYQRLQNQVDFHSVYDRIDLPLASMDVRNQLVERLKTDTPKAIADKAVIDCLDVDGYKFRLEDQSWLLIRFSGTEPVLRLYCEGFEMSEVKKTLHWARDWASS
ncbi:MAG: phosphoglucomutase/phosphomannomutase family protein [Spirulina sp. SIO3F2]|nr:phosphoglucomutase/phosphomannomutase family protein [Spirulina sp. SIO3F2]